MRNYARAGQAWFGLGLGLLLAALWIVTVGPVSLPGPSRDLPAIETHDLAGLFILPLAGVIAGQRFGHVAGWALLWWRLSRRKATYDLMPGHPDGAAGLAPIGRFHFRQVLVVGVPALYLAVWWLVIPALSRSYLRWRAPLLALLILAIAFEVLAFLGPMWVIHIAMRRQAELWEEEAGRLIPEIRSAQHELVEARSGHEAVSMRLAVLLERYHTLRKAPTWPVDPALRRRFTLNNAALLVPVVSYIAHNPQVWHRIASVLGGLRR
ncbi:hypothetical protein CTZ27_31680 [Streptomyces griseocarneus]|nr:hypothetical protein CTZ27_31680 [Streptomyces griseocarneus]